MTQQVRVHFAVTSNMSPFIRQVAAANAAVAKFNATTGTTGMIPQSVLQKMSSMLTSSGAFHQNMVRTTSEAEKFGKALGTGKVGVGQAFSAVKNMRKEMGVMNQLAQKQVRMQQSIGVAMGKNKAGVGQAAVFTPAALDMKSLATKTALASEKWKILNSTIRAGSQSMIDWGKNTQWAGRQMMVGLTIPLTMLAGAASMAFYTMDKELIRIQKVYGSGLSFGEDFKKQGEMIREESIKLSKELANAYGQSYDQTLKLTADIAATGKEGQVLMDSVRQTTRLAVLGEVDRQEAMKATLSLQSAFKMSTDELSQSVDFLNAVENQTSTSLQDLVEGIPRAGSTVKALGGDIQDLSLYMVAMREGGIQAGEAANALKSGLAAMIAPSKVASDYVAQFGVNLQEIVDSNAGDLTGTIMDFQKALQGLSDLEKQKVMAKLFGRYQMNRMSVLFANLGAEGSQTTQVLDLMNQSMETLAKTADQELATKMESASGQFQKTLETLKQSLAMLGEDFLGTFTKALSGITKIVDFFNNLGEGTKNFIKWGAIIAAIIGPVIMTIGVLGNFLGYFIKLGMAITALFSGKGFGRFKEFSAEMVGARAVADQLKTPFIEMEAVIKRATASIIEMTKALGVAASTSTAGIMPNLTKMLSSSGKSFTGSVMQTAYTNQLGISAGAYRPPGSLQSWSVSELTRDPQANRRMAAIGTTQALMTQGSGLRTSMEKLWSNQQFSTLKAAQDAAVSGSVSQATRDQAKMAIEKWLASVLKNQEFMNFFSQELSEADQHLENYTQKVMQQGAKLGAMSVGGGERTGRVLMSSLGSHLIEGSQVYSSKNLLPLAPPDIAMAKQMAQSGASASELAARGLARGPGGDVRIADAWSKMQAGHPIAKQELSKIANLQLQMEGSAKQKIQAERELAALYDRLGLVGEQQKAEMTQYVSELNNLETLSEQLRRATQERIVLEEKRNVLQRSEIETLKASKNKKASDLMFTERKKPKGGTTLVAIDKLESDIIKSLTKQGLSQEAAAQLAKKSLETAKQTTGLETTRRSLYGIINKQLKDHIIVNGQLVSKQSEILATDNQIAALGKEEASLSTNINRVKSQRAALEQNRLAEERKIAQKEKMRQRFQRAGMATMSLSMIGMFTGQQQGTGTGAMLSNAGMMAGMGAGMGMMFGPYGAAIGAAAGGLLGFAQKAGEAAKELQKSFRESAEKIANAARITEDMANKLGRDAKFQKGFSETEQYKGEKVLEETRVSGARYTPTFTVSQVEEIAGEKLQQFKDMTSAQALSASTLLYQQLLDAQVPAGAAKTFVEDLLFQAKKVDIVLKVRGQIAEIDLARDLGDVSAIGDFAVRAANTFSKQFNDAKQATGAGFLGTGSDWLSGGALNKEVEPIVREMTIAFADSLSLNLERAVGDQRDRWSAYVQESLAGVGEMIEPTELFTNAVSKINPEMLQKFEDLSIGITEEDFQSAEALTKKYLSLTAEQRKAFQEQTGAFKDFAITAEYQSDLIANAMINMYPPNIAGQIGELKTSLLEAEYGFTQYQATVLAAAQVTDQEFNVALQQLPQQIQQFGSLENAINGVAQTDPELAEKLELVSPIVDNAKVRLTELKESANLDIDVDSLSIQVAIAEAMGLKGVLESIENDPTNAVINIQTMISEQNIRSQSAAALAQWNDIAREYQTAEAESAVQTLDDNEDIADSYDDVGEAAQEASDAAIEAAEDASEARIKAAEKAIQAEEKQRTKAFEQQMKQMKEQMELAEEMRRMQIEAVQQEYDARIQAIEDQEEARERAFREEEKRVQRAKEMRDMQLKMLEGIATGDAFSVLGAQLEMRSAQESWQKEDEDERAKEQAELLKENLEAERDARIEQMEEIAERERELDQEKFERQQEFGQALLELYREQNQEKLEALRDSEQKQLEVVRQANQAATVDTQTNDAAQALSSSTKTSALVQNYENIKNRIRELNADSSLSTQEKINTLVAEYGHLGLSAQLAAQAWASETENFSENFSAFADIIALATSRGIELGVALDWAQRGGSVLEVQNRLAALKEAILGGGGQAAVSATMMTGMVRQSAQSVLGAIGGILPRGQAQQQSSYSPGQTRTEWMQSGDPRSSSILRSSGGPISGPGTSTSDSIPAWLSNGEYVIKADAVKKYGMGLMHAINAQRFAEGGVVGGKQLTGGIIPLGNATATVDEGAAQLAGQLGDARTSADMAAMASDNALASEKIKNLRSVASEYNKVAREQSSTIESLTSEQKTSDKMLEESNTEFNRVKRANSLESFNIESNLTKSLTDQTLASELVMGSAIQSRAKVSQEQLQNIVDKNKQITDDAKTQWSGWKDTTVLNIVATRNALVDSFKNINYKALVDMVEAYASGGTDAQQRGDAIKSSLQYASGGYVSGPGSATSDSIPARLSNGEYVVRQRSVQKYGVGMLNQINEGRFAEGGLVGAITNRVNETLNNAVQSRLQAMIDTGGTGEWGPPFRMSSTTHGGHFGGERDYPAPMGSPIYPVGPGRVGYIGGGKYPDNGDGSGGGAGNMVTVNHIIRGEPYSSTYMHMMQNSIAVAKDEMVNRQKMLGRVGNSGRSFGAHLHFEFSKGFNRSGQEITSQFEQIAGVKYSTRPGEQAGYLDNMGGPGLMSFVAPRVAKAGLDFSKMKFKAMTIPGANTPYTGDISKLRHPNGRPFPASVLQWAGLVEKVLKEQGLPVSYLPGILAQIQQESGGNPNAINLTDINAQRGDPSKGLLQTIGATYRNFAKPGYADDRYITEPYYNIWAAINYVKSQPNRRNAAGTRFGENGAGLFSAWNIGQNVAYGRGGMVIPALRSGATINYDNTLANLHRGETVLTAPLTQKFKDNLDVASGGSMNYTVNVNINKANANQQEIEQAVYGALERKERKMGRSRVIGSSR